MNKRAVNTGFLFVNVLAFILIIIILVVFAFTGSFFKMISDSPDDKNVEVDFWYSDMGEYFDNYEMNVVVNRVDYLTDFTIGSEVVDE